LHLSGTFPSRGMLGLGSTRGREERTAPLSPRSQPSARKNTNEMAAASCSHRESCTNNLAGIVLNTPCRNMHTVIFGCTAHVRIRLLQKSSRFKGRYATLRGEPQNPTSQKQTASSHRTTEGSCQKLISHSNGHTHEKATPLPTPYPLSA